MADSKSQQSLEIEHRVGCDIGEFSTNTPGRYSLTNILGEKNRARFVMPANSFSGGFKTIKLRVWGTSSGSGNKSLHFSVVNNKSFDKYHALHTAQLGTSEQNYYVEIVVTAAGRRSQNIHSTYISNTGLSTVDSSSSHVPFNADRVFRIYGETTDADDTLTVNRYEMFVCG